MLNNVHLPSEKHLFGINTYKCGVFFVCFKCSSYREASWITIQNKEYIITFYYPFYTEPTLSGSRSG